MRQSNWIWFVVIAVILNGSSVWAAKDADRPAYNLSRYKEDYSFLRDASRRTDYLDSLKYIPDRKSVV